MKLPVDLTRCFRPALTVVLVARTFAVLGCGSDDKGGGKGASSTWKPRSTTSPVRRRSS